MRDSRSLRRWLVLGGGCIALAAAFAARSEAVTRSSSSAHDSTSSAPLETAARSPLAWLASKSAPRTGVSGRVTGPGGAVSAARICAARAEGDPNASVSVCGESDAHGDYLIEKLEPGSYYVTGTARELALSSASREPIALLRGQLRTGLDFTLAPGERVAGVVVDALGGPVASARVRVLRLSAERLSVDTLTDREGRFELSAPAGPLVLRAQADGYAAAVMPSTAPNGALTITLLPGGTIRGHVVAAMSGKPLEGVSVRAEPLVGTLVAALPEPARSDDDGAFELRGAAPGTYSLVAEAPGKRGRAPSPVQLALGRTAEGVVIEMTTAARVQGRVLDLQGQPCALGSVLLGPALPGLGPITAEGPEQSEKEAPRPLEALSANLEIDGSVGFDAVPPGRYHVTLQCRDHVLHDGPEVLEVTARDQLGVTWHVEPGAALSIRVVDAAGRAAPGASFVLGFPQLEHGPLALMPLRADAHGAYETPASLYPGTYTLAAADTQDTHDAQPATVELKRGAGRVEVTLQLAGSASIVVDVHDRDGAPLDGLTVIASPIAADSARKAASGAMAVALGAGRYRLGPMLAGRYDVRADDGVNPSPRCEPAVELADGDSAGCSLVLDRGARLSGRVVDGAGHAMADVWVRASRVETPAETELARLSGGSARTLSDPSGAFAIESLAAGGRYEVRAEAADGSVAIQHDVPSASSITLVMAPSGETAALGSLVGPDAPDDQSKAAVTYEGK